MFFRTSREVRRRALQDPTDLRIDLEAVGVSSRNGGSVTIRIGFGPGRIWGMDLHQFAPLVDELEALGFDSFWLTDYVGNKTPEPMVGLAFAAGRTRHLKFGTSIMVLPGRNPVVVAKQVATLDRLSQGRMIPAFGLGVTDPHKRQGFGVERGARAAWFDEALPLLRRFWTEDEVDHSGPHFHYSGLRVLPKPVQRPLDVWLGGRAPSELRRVGRLGDGWLADPFSTPAEVASGWRVVNAAAAEAGRSIDPEHLGALALFAPGRLSDSMAGAVRIRRPDVNPTSVIAAGLDALVRRLQKFIAAGASILGRGRRGGYDPRGGARKQGPHQQAATLGHRDLKPLMRSRVLAKGTFDRPH